MSTTKAVKLNCTFHPRLYMRLIHRYKNVTPWLRDAAALGPHPRFHHPGRGSCCDSISSNQQFVRSFHSFLPEQPSHMMRLNQTLPFNSEKTRTPLHALENTLDDLKPTHLLYTSSPVSLYLQSLGAVWRLVSVDGG